MITYQQADRLRALAGRLRRRSKIRPILMETADGYPQDDDALQLLQKAALGRTEGRRSEKVAALWGLAYAGIVAGDTEAARATLRTVLRNRERRPAHRAATRISWAVIRTLSVALLAGLGGAVAGYSMDRLRHANGSVQFILILVMLNAVALGFIALLMPIGSLVGDWFTQIEVRAEAARALGEVAMPGDIPALCEASREASATVHVEAKTALKELLSRLSDDDYRRVPSETTPGLCRLLNDFDHDLICIVVEALAKVGDGRAAEPVQRLLRQYPFPRTRVAAENALPILQERLRRQTDPTTLMRAVNDPVSPADSLLRPAAGAGSSASDLLPRPVEVLPLEQSTD
jgi:hypothetical protein